MYRVTFNNRGVYSLVTPNGSHVAGSTEDVVRKDPTHESVSILAANEEHAIEQAMQLAVAGL